METLRNQHEDPFDAILAGIQALGFSGEIILEADPSDPSVDAPDSAYEYLQQDYRIAFGDGGRRDDPHPIDHDDVWDHAGDLFSNVVPTSYALDYEWHAHNVLKQLPMWRFGYGLSVTFPAKRWARNPSLSTTHPEVFVAHLIDHKTGDLTHVPMRLPPANTETVATRNQRGAAALVNHAVLDDLGLEIVRQVLHYSDGATFWLLEQAALDQMEEKYGEGLPLFDPDQPLVERGFLDHAADSYAPDCALDHEAEFGVPEPPNTVKLEPVLDGGRG